MKRWLMDSMDVLKFRSSIDQAGRRLQSLTRHPFIPLICDVSELQELAPESTVVRKFGGP